MYANHLLESTNYTRIKPSDEGRNSKRKIPGHLGCEERLGKRNTMQLSEKYFPAFTVSLRHSCCHSQAEAISKNIVLESFLGCLSKEHHRWKNKSFTILLVTLQPLRHICKPPLPLWQEHFPFVFSKKEKQSQLFSAEDYAAPFIHPAVSHRASAFQSSRQESDLLKIMVMDKQQQSE